MTLLKKKCGVHALINLRSNWTRANALLPTNRMVSFFMAKLLGLSPRRGLRPGAEPVPQDGRPTRAIVQMRGDGLSEVLGFQPGLGSSRRGQVTPIRGH